MQEVTEARQDDILERVLLREVELARAQEALRHEHFERRRIEKIREIFAELGEKLIDASAPHQAAVAILNAADHLFGWDAAFVDVYSKADQRFHAVVRFDVKDGVRAEIPHSSGSVSFTPLREQLFNQGPLLILRREEPDAAEEWLLAFGSAEKRSASLMFVPMSRDGNTIGVLSIQSYGHDAYTRKDLDLLQVLGNYCCHGLQRGFAETRLQQSQQKLGILERMTPALVWTADHDGNVLSGEGSGWRALNLDPDEVRGKTLSELFRGADLLKAHAAAVAGEAAQCRLTLAGGMYQVQVEPMVSGAGVAACCLGVMLPIVNA